MVSCLDVTPLFRDSNFIKVGRKKFIQMDRLSMYNTNSFDFSIKACMAICIYYENLPSMFENEPLNIPYLMEVLECLVEVSIGGTFCWVRIFEIHVNLIGRCTIFPKV
jgi:hypothetical protein